MLVFFQVSSLLGPGPLHLGTNSVSGLHWNLLSAVLCFTANFTASFASSISWTFSVSVPSLEKQPPLFYGCKIVTVEFHYIRLRRICVG